MLFTDVFLLEFALLSAFALRFSEFWPVSSLQSSWSLFIFTPVVGAILFKWLGLYRVVVRSMSLKFLGHVATGVFILVIFQYSLSIFFDIGLPRSVTLIFGLTSWFYIGGSRLVVFGYIRFLISKNNSLKKTLIYGAGRAGLQLLNILKESDKYQVIGFVDDDVTLHGSMISGRPVYSSNEIKSLIKNFNVRQFFLAVPSASDNQRKSILNRLSGCPVKVQSVPSMSEILEGKELGQLTKIQLDDLLGRDVVMPNPKLLSESIQNKVVCVTGAGGSIGSELSRKSIENGVKNLILFEQSEFALYAIERELSIKISNLGLNCKLTPVLGSVTNEEFLTKIFIDYEVETVYHAAAYKHVPLVEANGFAGLMNNVFGTQSAALAAIKAKAERFILISTDKAVRPTNIMGATKRIAEQILQNLAEDEGQKTIFSMVRFGNVLGSSGSVVPLFESQIKQGGPVTVTHPDVTRFFMSISEAASLVIQAGSIAKGGEVFLLDMGQPVRISKLAELMIHLSGNEIKSTSNPEGDIEITYVGLRPGEKLFEELLIDAKSYNTVHPKILAANEEKISSGELKQLLDEIILVSQEGDLKQMQQLLRRAGIGYNPAQC